MNSYASFFFFFLLSTSLPLVIHSRSIVSELPGFDGPLPFYLETGYVMVDEEKDAQLFYYFVKSESNPDEDPLLLWLTGGPGCSGFSGLATENVGPINFQKLQQNGSVPTLILNPLPLTKISSILFVDSPVGTGFSFSSNSDHYSGGDLSTSQHLYIFLRKWFIDHPEFLHNDFYLSGASYAGKIIPLVADIIFQGIEAKFEPAINFKGIIVGNPIVGENAAIMSKIPYAYTHGLIPKEFYESVIQSCEGDNYLNPRKESCARHLKLFSKLTWNVSIAYVLGTHCEDSGSEKKIEKSYRRAIQEIHEDILDSISPPPLWCSFYPSYFAKIWANLDITRTALHVQKGSIGTWYRCRTLDYTTDVPSAVGYYLNLTRKGYRALIYSGDQDMMAPHFQTQEWIRSFDLPITHQWRPWWLRDQVAGYTRTYSNILTFATVLGGGHVTTSYKPKECFEMFKRWINHEQL